MGDEPSLPSKEVQELLQFLYVCPIGLVSFGTDGTVAFINPETVNLLLPAFGVTDFANVFSMLEAVWPELADAVRTWSGPEGEIVAHNRVRSNAPTGPTWVSLSVKRVADSSFMLSVVDVSASAMSEDALRESEGRLRSVFDSIDEGYCICEIIVDALGEAIDYLFLEVNPKFEEFTGLKAPVGRTAKQLVPDLEAVWVETYARVAMGGETLRFEQGSEVMGRWFDVFAMPMNPQGRFVIVFKDQTSKRVAEVALRESEQRFRDMADHLPVLVWVYDESGKYTWVNQTYCGYFGVSRDDLGNEPKHVFDHSDEGFVTSDFVAKVASREPFHGEFQVRRGDGELRWVESWAQPQFDKAGTYVGHLGTSVDVNDRVLGERHLADMVVRERQTRDRVELLQRNAINLAAATTVAEIATSVLTDLKAALGAELAAINLVDGDAIRIFASPLADPEGVDRYQGIGADSDLPGPVAIRTNRPVVLNSSEEIGERFRMLSVDRYAVETLVALPIPSPTGVAIGALVVGSPTPNWASGGSLSLLEAIAGQTGQALERARLHEAVVAVREQEHTIAMLLQRALLPDRLVEHPSLSLSARYSAAGDLVDVGGDWYDTFEWSGRHVGVVVGDVVGHDIAAATVMGQLRNGVAALVPFMHPGPADMLNAYAHCVRNHGNTFATAGCVVIDTNTGTAAYSLAGHPPPLLMQPDGSTTWLDAALAPPMDSHQVDQYTEASITLMPGSTIVMYSDGLIERRGESLALGLERLSNAASRHASIVDIDSFASLLVAELTADAIVQDDIVVVCIRWQTANGRTQRS
jgi:PAS domain S-box-containing protein